jgi:hypothetical protein
MMTTSSLAGGTIIALITIVAAATIITADISAETPIITGLGSVVGRLLFPWLYGREGRR